MKRDIKEKWKEKEILDLVREKKVSLRKGASLLGLNYREFLKLMDEQEVPVFDYEEGWLEREMATFEKLNKKKLEKGKVLDG
jgi:predicted HTH domain antitoxin